MIWNTKFILASKLWNTFNLNSQLKTTDVCGIQINSQYTHIWLCHSNEKSEKERAFKYWTTLLHVKHQCLLNISRK